MKKNILTLLYSFLLYNFSFSQAQFSPASKRFLFDYQNEINVYHKTVFTPSHKLQETYGLYQKGSRYYIGALVLVRPEKLDVKALKKLELRQFKTLGDLYSIRIPIENLSKLAQVKGVKLIDAGDSYAPHLQDLVKSTRADSAQRGLGGLTQAFSGKNVVVAIIDWGFDYTHPMFYDSTLNQYRVVRAWDQNKMSGPPPAGFDFGTAYETKEALLAAKEDTLYVFGPGSHGTHVAGIAGGAGGGTPHVGVALNSELIFISLRRDAPSLIDAYLYIEKYAKSVNKPFVVNMSFGNHLGPHDGNSLENIGIDKIVGKGKIAVGSAGNNGTNNFHIKHNFKLDTDTLKTVVNFTTMANYYGQALSMWGSAESEFSVRFKLVKNDNTDALVTPWYSSVNEPVQTDSWIANTGDTVEVRITATASFVSNQKPNILAEIRKKGNLRLVMEAVSKTNCELHIWNVIRLHNRFTNWGMDLTNNYPGATAGNPGYGLGEPSGVGKNILTVGSYRSEVQRANGTFSYGQISSFSSCGPTVDERRKPDITGPGHEVVSSVNSYDPTPKTVAASTVFNGRTYEFEAYSGTSMSGPAIAGLVAMLLEKNPSLDHEQVKELLQKTARQDVHTGSFDKDTGSLVWGSGKANILAALWEADKYPIVLARNFEQFQIYPNPSLGEATFRATEDAELKVYNANGQLVFQNRFRQNALPHAIDLQHVNQGVYHFIFTAGNKIYSQKWIKLNK